MPDSPTQPWQPANQTPPPPPQPGYPPPPPGWQQGPPPPPDNNTTRNIVIGVVVALLLVLIVAAVFVFANWPPEPSFPPIIPTAAPPSAQPTKTPKQTPTEQPAQTQEAPTEEPTVAPPTEQLPTAEPTEVPASPTAEPPTQAPPSERPTQPTPQASTIPGTEDHGLILGSPVVIGDPDFQEVTLLVQNIDSVVKSYSLKATFKDGDTITATATGIVNDHLQGTIRTPTLFVAGTPGPTDTITVQVDTMFSEDPTTEGGELAKQVTFGPPTITVGDFPTIDVEVTNGSESTISVTVAAGIMRDGQLVGIGSAVVTDMAPGQTKTATMFVTGSIEETDELLLTVETAVAGE